jgi:hypothetical protein
MLLIFLYLLLTLFVILLAKFNTLLKPIYYNILLNQKILSCPRLSATTSIHLVKLLQVDRLEKSTAASPMPSNKSNFQMLMTHIKILSITLKALSKTKSTYLKKPITLILSSFMKLSIKMMQCT